MVLVPLPRRIRPCYLGRAGYMRAYAYLTYVQWHYRQRK